MLYVDSPVGTGYSFAANATDIGSYASSSYPGVTHMLVQLLDAIYDDLALWSRSNPLIVAGESYGGHYCPALATSLLEANDGRNDGRRFRLHGVAIGDGLTDPATQVVSKPDAALAFGLIGTTQHARAQVAAAEAARLALNGSYESAKADREAMEAIVATSGVNLYDVRLYGEYNSSATRAFLNLPTMRARFGVPAWRGFGTTRTSSAQWWPV